MKLSDFTMRQINIALDGQPEKLGEWKGGSRSCLIGVGEMGGKKYQVKIHASDPKWFNTDEGINLKKAELAAAPEEERDRILSELDTLKSKKPVRDKKDKISDQFLEMRQKLASALNSIGTRLVVANAEVWKEKIPFRGNSIYAVEATPWLEELAVGLTEEDNLPLKFSDLDVNQQYKIVASLADILSKVHAKGIIHGDLKIGNTLITKEGGEFKVALIDYDAAFILDDLRRRKYDLIAWSYVIGGTFIAPEFLGFYEITSEGWDDEFNEFDLNTITEKSDIFSLGVTIYEYFYGRADKKTNLMRFVRPDGTVYDTYDYGAAINSDYELKLPDTVPDFLFGMINWMMAPNPAERPTAIQVRDAFATANANLIPSKFTRCPLWDEHRDRYELTLPDGASISKGSKPKYRVKKSGAIFMSTYSIEELVGIGYANDRTGGTATKKAAQDPTKLWPQDGDGKLPICVRCATAPGTYQMTVKGIRRYYTYAKLCEEGVICSEADMHTPWPCDAEHGLKFNKSGIMRDMGAGKGPGHYVMGTGLAAIRRTTRELVNAGDASYGVDIKLHPSDAMTYNPNPSAVPSNVTNIFPDPMMVHRYVIVAGAAITKMMIEDLATKGYVKIK